MLSRCMLLNCSIPCPHAGLNRSFSSGVVYCSPITAILLKKDMGLPAERVIPLSVNSPHVIDGVTVILMDANHCPGACMMLFKVPTKHSKPQVRVLYCTQPCPHPPADPACQAAANICPPHLAVTCTQRARDVALQHV